MGPENGAFSARFQTEPDPIPGHGRGGSGGAPNWILENPHGPVERGVTVGMTGDESAGADIAFHVNASPNEQLSIKLLFESGSADDPEGKEGLAALSAAMLADAGSSEMSYEEIQKTLFPISGGFGSRVDREMTVFNGAIHADNFRTWAEVALRQLTTPGYAVEDFERVKTNLRNALVLGLRSNDDEELGKEVLQQAVFAGTPYGHPTLGTMAGIDAITLEDVQQFATQNCDSHQIAE